MPTASPNDDRNIFRVAEGDAYCWAEQESSVMLKAVTKFGDPVELSAAEARLLALELKRLADEVDA